MAEKIPEEVLSAICCETEDRSSSLRTSVRRKHLKNLNVLALSQVCRMWRFHIDNNKSLWRDIAFDVSDIWSIKTAEHFLSMVERADILFSVFADLYGDPYGAVGIVARLQPLTNRISHFEYFGALGECRQYLDRPAYNLRHLSGSPDLDQNPTILSDPLFAGGMPHLRSLTTMAIANCAGWSTSLPRLMELELVPQHYGCELPFESLRNMLQGVPNLRTLKISGLGRINTNQVSNRVTLPNLKILDLNQSDIGTILNHLEMPRLQRLASYGSDYPPGYTVLAPVFQAPHFFAQITQIPILNQEVAEVFLMAGKIGEDRRFWFRLHSSCRRYSLDIRMCWSRVAASGWEGYIERSIVTLEKLLVLSPRAQISLDFHSPFSQPLFIPFFRSPQVYHLTINCGLAEAFSRSLALAKIYYPPLQLRRLELTDGSPAAARVIQLIGSYLLGSGVKFSVRTSRGPLPFFDVFDVPDVGYIVFPYLLFLSAR